MYFQQFLHEDLGCASYLIGSPDAGECVAVDPRTDIDRYLAAAAARGLRITHIVETHVHADHLSGRTRLAAVTGAVTHVHPLAGARYEHVPFSDGDELAIGPVRLRCVHVPGHRPEHIGLVVYDDARSPDPWLVLTGDSLLIGDVARPDLAMDQTDGATALFGGLGKIMSLPDSVQLFPGHVAGSLCGRVTSAIGSSTIGYERRNNPALQETLAEFVEVMTRDLPPRPPNMAVIVQKNRGDLPIREPDPKLLDPEAFQAIVDEGVVILDARTPEEFAAGHVAESLNLAFANPQFANTAGWSIPPEEPIVLVVSAGQDARAVAEGLAAVGLDDTIGLLAGGVEAWEASGRPVETIAMISSAELESLAARHPEILDLREPSQFQKEHLPGSRPLPFRDLGAAMRQLPKDRPIVAVCEAGYVSSVAAKMLTAAGFEAYTLTGGINEWKRYTASRRTPVGALS